MTSSPAYPRGSIEYLEGTVSADITLDMGVQLALTRGNAAHVWLPAEWEGSAGTTRIARTSSPVTFDATYPYSAYTLYARLDGAFEDPIIRLGTVYVLGAP